MESDHNCNSKLRALVCALWIETILNQGPADGVDTRGRVDQQIKVTVSKSRNEKATILIAISNSEIHYYRMVDGWVALGKRYV